MTIKMDYGSIKVSYTFIPGGFMRCNKIRVTDHVLKRFKERSQIGGLEKFSDGKVKKLIVDLFQLGHVVHLEGIVGKKVAVIESAYKTENKDVKIYFCVIVKKNYKIIFTVLTQRQYQRSKTLASVSRPAYSWRG